MLRGTHKSRHLAGSFFFFFRKNKCEGTSTLLNESDPIAFDTGQFYFLKELLALLIIPEYG